MSSTTECRCGKPTRDAAYFCDQCGDDLSQALGDIPWLDTELETTITGETGIDYRTLGGGKGGKKPSEMPSPVNWSAADARAHLKGLLVSWVLFCNEDGIRHQSPRDGLPDDTLTDLAKWMLWRVDGLALHDIGPDAVDEITDAVTRCHRFVDRHPQRQYLGPHDGCDDAGSLYATPHSQSARCDVCSSTVDAIAVKAKRITELEDRLCTAAEIARLSTYLGFKADRDKVRNRINQWHHRGKITPSMLAGEIVFPFGVVYKLLAADEYA